MVSEIFVYVEGGKLGKTVRQLRVGLRGFLKEIDEMARSRKIRMRIVPSGSTHETRRDFLRGAGTHPEALADFYGTGFNRKAIPGNPKVEQIEKEDLLRGLERATQNTRKGKYHKTMHAFKLLERLDASRVRAAAPHCDRFFDAIMGRM